MEITSISISSGTIPSTKKKPIYYDLYAPVSRNAVSIPVILFLHGFKGFKDWGPFPDACEELALAGFGVVAMNFSMNGIGENKTEFTETENFANQTFSQDLDDIGSVIKALQYGEIDSEHANFNIDKIGLVGHSRGGHSAITAAVEYDSIQCLVTWAAVADYKSRWTDEMVNDWKDKGYTEILNTRTGQKMKLNKVVYEDFIQNEEKLNAIKRVKKLNIPTLFIHGRNDESVAYTHSEKLYIACTAKEKELRLISNTGHTFGAAHPFNAAEFPAPFKEVLSWTEGWFLEYLR